MIAIGSVLPSVNVKLVTGQEVSDVDTGNLFKGKKVVLFAVPGAFTPTCSNAHVPGYVAHADTFKSQGVDAIICLAVNDVFVLKAWGDMLGVANKVLFISDGNGDFTSALGMQFDARGAGLGLRSKRFAMLVEDGVVKALSVEENPGACTVSGADSVLGILK